MVLLYLLLALKKTAKSDWAAVLTLYGLNDYPDPHQLLQLVRQSTLIPSTTEPAFSKGIHILPYAIPGVAASYQWWPPAVDLNTR